jgi:hypothetical protein
VKRHLERVPLPDEQAAEERSWRIVRAAYEEREPVAWPRRHARPLALAAAGVALVAAAVTPPGQSVVNSVRDVVGREKVVGVANAHRELVRLPAPGQLLIQSPRGPWIVQPSGARRFLGSYTMASWSPHAKFVAAVRFKYELVALDRHGNIRWARGRKQPIRFPRWSFEGYRIAYLSSDTLRVVTGDGVRDWGFGNADPRVAPAWKPGTHEVAWVGADGDVRIADADRKGRPARVNESRRIVALAWVDGELSAIPARSTEVAGTVVTADVAPTTGRTATIVRQTGRSRVYLDGRLLFSGAGVMDSVAFSPNEQWLVIGWRSADQLVFVRVHPPKLYAVSNVTRQFGLRFPTIAGWCCTP